MKLFCDCNSDWINGNNRQVTGTGSRERISLGQCGKCGYMRWYDADYENMMHDLRRMNS